jgi:hypothetical protein
MRKALFILSVIIFAPSLRAQTTSLSATVTDAGGVIWKNGTWSLTFLPSSSNPTANYFQNGVPFSKNQIFSGNLDNTGSFTSAAVPDNLTIAPAGSNWTLQVCPLATASNGCYNKNFTITGASQNLTASVTPPAVVVDFSSPPPGGASAYTDGETFGARVGNFYFNLTDGTFHVCTVPACTWVSDGFGVGSVTSFSSGNLSPLFTTLVATPTSTPALSFSLSTAPANTVFGNCSGSPAPPSYCSILLAMLGSLGGSGTTVVHGNGSASAVNLATDVTGQLPIGEVGSAGLSGVSPISVAATGAISCSTCSTGGVTSVTGTSPVVSSGGTTPAISCPTCIVSNGFVMKAGSNAGDYSSSSTTFVNVDGTNLSYTVLIPVGSKLAIIASGDISAPAISTSVTTTVAISDGGTPLVQTVMQDSNGDPSQTSFSLAWLITGDGASHTITLQYRMLGGSASNAIIRNSLGVIPTMLFLGP